MIIYYILPIFISLIDFMSDFTRQSVTKTELCSAIDACEIRINRAYVDEMAARRVRQGQISMFEAQINEVIYIYIYAC
jgi:hypothetical protein